MLDWFVIGISAQPRTHSTPSPSVDLSSGAVDGGAEAAEQIADNPILSFVLSVTPWIVGLGLLAGLGIAVWWWKTRREQEGLSGLFEKIVKGLLGNRQRVGKIVKLDTSVVQINPSDLSDIRRFGEDLFKKELENKVRNRARLKRWILPEGDRLFSFQDDQTLERGTVVVHDARRPLPGVDEREREALRQSINVDPTADLQPGIGLTDSNGSGVVGYPHEARSDTGWRLQFCRGEKVLQEFPIIGSLEIGRVGVYHLVKIPNAVSRKQFVIELNGDVPTIINLSGNGTMVNGVGFNDGRQLTVDDKITIPALKDNEFYFKLTRMS
ncbi:FHA domain-containing protein [Buchananella felis]|uniref:FHA domain-containing protein n=1 Tax=Buchananella felis TaxID=3231492 RepID=UPI0035293A3E